jgi:hypothetical protein
MVDDNVEDDGVSPAAATGGDVAATLPTATAAVIAPPPPSQPTTQKMTLATVYDALKELKDASWLATAKEAVAVATAAARKVEHVALDVNAIRDKSYEASVMALASAGSADAASALKLLRADMEGLKAVARRVDVRHAEDTLAFQTLRELQKHGRKTAAKVGELERQLKATHAAHAKEMTELRAMIEEGGGGGGGRRRNRGGTAAAAAVAADDSSLRPFQREARRRRRVRQLRLAEGLDDDPEALGDELEGLALGLDDHADALAALRSELARVDAARVTDRLRLTLSAGARLLARAFVHRRTLTLRQRLMTWRRHTRRNEHDDHQRGRGPGGLGIRSVASQTRMAGQAQVLQSALARVGNWAEIRMRPRFDKWRAWAGVSLRRWASLSRSLSCYRYLPSPQSVRGTRRSGSRPLPAAGRRGWRCTATATRRGPPRCGVSGGGSRPSPAATSWPSATCPYTHRPPATS